MDHLHIAALVCLFSLWLAEPLMRRGQARELLTTQFEHKLFEYASQIPASLLASKGQQKFLLREAAKPYITENISQRLKKPFLAPPSTLRIGNKLYDFTQDMLRSQSMQKVPFFNQSAIVNLLDKIPAMDNYTRASLDPLLLMMVSMCILHDRYCS